MRYCVPAETSEFPATAATPLLLRLLRLLRLPLRCRPSSQQPSPKPWDHQGLPTIAPSLLTRQHRRRCHSAQKATSATVLRYSRLCCALSSNCWVVSIWNLSRRFWTGMTTKSSVFRVWRTRSITSSPSSALDPLRMERTAQCVVWICLISWLH